jgi:heme a synthase
MEPVWWRRPSTVPVVLLLMALTIIVAGGTIRINDAGESCPDWPQCFGTWGFDVSVDEQAAYWEANPDQVDSRGEDHRYTTFEIFTEWIHRALAACIAIPVLLNALLLRAKRSTYGERAYRLSIFAGIMLILQATAGAVTVLYDNADWSVALHLSMACIFSAIFIFQHMEMRSKEGSTNPLYSLPSAFIDANKKRVNAMVGAVFTLLILGAWVSSTAGGQYNQGCSVGFPTGWPQCNGSVLPSFDGPGALVQMVHRFGALIVGLVLVTGSARIRSEAREHKASPSFGRVTDFTAGFWMLNVMIGGSYIVSAKMDNFPEWVSLLHLVVGVTGFLVATTALFSMLISASNADDHTEEA